MSEKLKDFTSEYEARLFYANNSGDPSFKLAGGSIIWKDRIINNNNMTINNLSSKIEVKSSSSLKVSCVKTDSKNNLYFSSYITNQLEFFIDDLKTKGLSVLRSYLRHTYYPNSYYSYYIKCDDDKILKEFLDNFPKIKTTKISDLVSSLPVNNKVLEKRKKTKVKLLTGRGKTEGDIREAPEVDVDIEDGGIYLISRNCIIDFDNKNKYLFKSNMDSLTKLVNQPVYIVPVSISSKFTSNKKWKRFETLAEEEFNKIIVKYDVDYLKYASSIKITSNAKSINNLYIKYKNRFSANSPIETFCKELKKVESLQQTAAYILPLVSIFNIKNIKSTTKSKDIDLSKLYTKVVLEYPMLEMVLNCQSIDNITFMNYVEMCDKYKKLTDKKGDKN